MANVLGSLLVELGINVAAFTSGLDKATYKTQQSMREMKAAFGDIGGKISEAFSAIGGFGGAVDSAFSRVTSSTAAFIRSGTMIATSGELSLGAIAGIGGAAIGAGAAAGALALHTMDLAQGFVNMSAATGLSIRDVQVWERAAKEAGVSSEGLMSSLGRVQMQLGRYIETGGRAAGMSGMFVRTMNELGISLKDNEGHVPQMNDLLIDFAEVLNRVSDAEQRTALARVAMGRGGADFAEWANSVRVQGGDVRTTLEEIEKQSGILTDQQAIDLARDRAEYEKFVQKVEDVGIRVGAVFARMAEDIATNRKMFDEQGNLIRRTAPPPAAAGPAIDVSAINKQNEAMQRNIDVIALGSKARANLKEAEEKLSAATAAGDMAAEMAAAKQVASAKAAVDAETESDRVIKTHTDDVAKHTAAMQAEIAAHTRFAGALGTTSAAIERNRAIEAADTDAGRMRAALLEREAEEEQKLADASSKHGKAAAAAAADASRELDLISAELDELTASTAAWEKLAVQKQETATNDTLYARLVEETDKIHEQTAAIIEEGNARTAQALIEARVNAAMASDRAKVAAGGGRADDAAAFAAEEAAEHDNITAAIQKQFEAEQRTSAANVIAINTETAAVLQGAEARREAAVQAEVGRFKAAHEDFDPSQMASVAAMMEQQSEAQRQLADAQKAASLDVRRGFEDEIEELERVDALYGESRDIHVAVAAAEVDAERKMQHELDTTYEKVGTLGEGFRAFASELILQGQNLQTNFFSTLETGVDGFESSLAKFVVTGRGGFIQVLRQMEEALIKLAIQFLVMKALKGLGLDNLLGGGQAGAQVAQTTALTAATTTNTAARMANAVAITSQTAALVAQTAAQATSMGAAAGAEGLIIAFAEIARQASIGQAAAEAAAWAAASGGPAAAIAAAAETLGSLEGITALAGGGDVMPGHSYLVGEKHPEVLVAGTAGHVYPSVGDAQRSGGSGAGGGNQTNINVNHSVSALDAQSFRSVLTEHSDILGDVISSHLRRLNFAV